MYQVSMRMKWLNVPFTWPPQTGDFSLTANKEKKIRIKVNKPWWKLLHEGKIPGPSENSLWGRIPVHNRSGNCIGHGLQVDWEGNGRWFHVIMPILEVTEMSKVIFEFRDNGWRTNSKSGLIFDFIELKKIQK